MKEQNPPAGWIYRPLAFLCRVVSRLLFRLEVEESGDIPREGPLLLLSSHQGMVDFILLIAALRGRRIRFVATQRQFRNPKLHWAYVRLRMIPKVQFHTDPRCVMGILRALKGGGTVGIFPAGQTSMCGTPEGMTPAVAHLVKKAGVPVCTASIHGGFFTWPRFGHGWNRGRTQVRLRLAFSPAELKALPEEEIYEKIVRDLDYDDYAWQEKTGTRFSGKHRAGGYGNVLIRCPKCGKWGAMADRGNRVFCRSCGNGGTVGEDMRIRPDSGESRVFPTLKEWYAWQGEGIELPLTLPARCQRFDEDAFAYRDAGAGEITLTESAIAYRGTLAGEETELTVPIRDLPGLSAAPGKYLELYHQGYGLLRYVPKNAADGWRVTALKQEEEARFAQI